MNLLLLIPGLVMLGLAALFFADLFADFDDGPRDRPWIFVAVLARCCQPWSRRTGRQSQPTRTATGLVASRSRASACRRWRGVER